MYRISYFMNIKFLNTILCYVFVDYCILPVLTLQLGMEKTGWVKFISWNATLVIFKKKIYLIGNSNTSLKINFLILKLI